MPANHTILGMGVVGLFVVRLMDQTGTGMHLDLLQARCASSIGARSLSVLVG